MFSVSGRYDHLQCVFPPTLELQGPTAVENVQISLYQSTS